MINLSKSVKPILPILRGKSIEASYQEAQIQDYSNNPLIEGLPLIWDEKQVVHNLVSRPIYSEDERSFPSHLRLHMIQRIYRDYFQPLSIHLELEQRLSRLIRDGYVGRNPLEQNYAFRARKDAESLIKSGEHGPYPVLSPSSSGFAIVGISGIGKSTTIQRILTLYPQVILHSQYKKRHLNLYQVVWLKMDCPHDGSIKGLCLNFFHALDLLLGTNYYKKHAGGRKSVDELLPIMAQIAAVHCLGVLIIDEIQNLSEAKSGGSAKMLNFFVQLVNTIGVPVIIVGTFKALPVLDGEFRNARRGTGQGDLIWDRMKNDDEWEFFLKGLWKFQWTKEKSNLTSEIIDLLYYESQGITDIAVKLFMLSQWRAIDTEQETITPSIIKSVAKDRLQLVQPALKALRTGDKKKIVQFGDIYSSVSINNFIEELNQKEKQEQRLEILKQELDYDPTEKIIEKVSAWLVNAGISKEIADESAKIAFNKNKEKFSEIDLNQVALSIAISKIIPINTKSQKAINQRKKITSEDSDNLKNIALLATKKKISNYDALNLAGYIKNANEFLA